MINVWHHEACDVKAGLVTLVDLETYISAELAVDAGTVERLHAFHPVPNFHASKLDFRVHQSLHAHQIRNRRPERCRLATSSQLPSTTTKCYTRTEFAFEWSA